MQPELGTKISKITSLSNDIKLNLAVEDIRFKAPIPGKAAIGIEIPNREKSIVTIRDLLESREFKEFPSNVAFAVGKDIYGKIIIADIAKMPHLLIAGTTGSGKSVFIDSIIMSVLYKAHPYDVKMILIDSKGITLNIYSGIPHLIIPIVTEPKKASAALHWGVAEMVERYKKLADFGVKNLKEYNEKIELLNSEDNYNKLEKLSQILIIIDDLSDLMAVSPKEIEENIVRLAQMSIAVGIHLVIATQRPSTDVITGLIKANIPSRIAFSVFSAIDSRVIIDEKGAEELLGNGDMLFKPLGYTKPARIQGAYVSDKEVSDVVGFLNNQAIGNFYNEDIEGKIKNVGSETAYKEINSIGNEIKRDQYFADAGRFVIDKDKASIGMLQRVFKIGFCRAARIMDELCSAGVVGEEEGTRPRKILMSLDEFEKFLEENF